jgi:hypothetical protein
MIRSGTTYIGSGDILDSDCLTLRLLKFWLNSPYVFRAMYN